MNILSTVKKWLVGSLPAFPDKDCPVLVQIVNEYGNEIIYLENYGYRLIQKGDNNYGVGYSCFWWVVKRNASIEDLLFYVKKRSEKEELKI